MNDFVQPEQLLFAQRIQVVLHGRIDSEKPLEVDELRQFAVRVRGLSAIDTDIATSFSEKPLAPRPANRPLKTVTHLVDGEISQLAISAS